MIRKVYRLPLAVALVSVHAAGQPMISIASAAPQLTFRNTFNAISFGAPFVINAKDFYSEARLPSNTPFAITTPEGRQIPVTLSADKKKLLVYLPLNAGEQVQASVNPAPHFQNSLYSLEKNRMETPASGFHFDSSGGNFYFKMPGRSPVEIIRNLSLRCWIDTEERGMLNAETARDLGLQRVELSSLPAQSITTNETPTTLHILQQKKEGDVFFEEEAVLYKEEPLIEYIVRITNTGDDSIYLANMQGGESVMAAEYGSLFIRGDRLVLYRDSSNHRSCPPVVVLSRSGAFSDQLKPSQGWNRAATYCMTDDGYGLGVIMARPQKFSHMWHRWNTALNGFSVPLSTEASPLPARILPQETVEVATAVYAVMPGNDGFSWVLNKHDAFWKNKPFTAETKTEIHLNGIALRKPFVPERILPEQVKLIQPFDGATVSDVAATFAHEVAENAITYQIQIASDPDFTSCLVDEQTWSFPSRVSIPHHALQTPLPPGTYFWRIRAESQTGDSGPWSEFRRVVIESTDEKKVILRPITPDNPIFKIDIWRVSDLAAFIHNLPSDLPAEIAVGIDQISAAVISNTDIEAIRNSNRPYVLSYNIPLCMVEALLRDCPNILGIDAGEYIGTFERFERMARLCAKYGRYLMYWGGNEMQFEWAQRFSDPQWSRLFSEYGDYILFGHKTNQSNLAYTTMSTLMGAWLNGQIGTLGMHYEAFYWDHAGYRRNLDECFGPRGGQSNMMPPNFWNLQMLVGLTQGCGLLSIGGQGNAILPDETPYLNVPFWEEEYRDTVPEHRLWTAVWTTGGNMTAIWDRFVGPFIHGVLAQDMMLTRSEVEAMIPTAVVDDLPVHVGRHNNKWLHYKPLFENTYGLDNEFSEINELIPNLLQTYWIPLLYGALKQWSGNTIQLSQLQTGEEIKNHLTPSSVSRSEGNAFTVTTGEKFYIMNSGENHSATQHCAIDFNNRAISRIETEVTAHKYIIGRNRTDGSFWLQANTAYPEDATTLTLTGEAAVRMTVSPAEALIAKTTSGEETTFLLSHTKGAVELHLQRDE